MYEIDEWTIEKDRREDDLWLVYPTKQGRHSCNFKYFASEVEAIDFAENYAAPEEK